MPGIRSCARLVALAALALGGCAHGGRASAAAATAARAESSLHRLPLTPTTTLVLEDARAAAELLGARDEYVAAMTPLDRRIRARSKAPVDEATYLARAVAEARDFSPQEAGAVALVVAEIARELEALPGGPLPFPETIHVLKTTGAEEGIAGEAVAYTRGPSIVLTEGAIPDSLAYIVRHELFHVLSRQSPELRDALYAVLGYRRVARIALPPELERRRLTNPDAPSLEHALRLTVEGREVDVVNVLVASAEDAGGGLFEHLAPVLVAIDDEGAVLPGVDGPLSFPTSAPEYLERVGYNTGYVMQPEEILADNFVFLLEGRFEIPSPWVLDGLREVLAHAGEAR